MKNLLLLLCLALPLPAQVLLDRNALPSVTWINQFGDAPFPLAVSITGTGTSLASGTCTGSGCSALQVSFCAVGVQPCSVTGTAPATMYVWFSGYTIQGMAAGTYPVSFPVTASTTCNGGASCTVTASLVVANRAVTTVRTIGAESGCSKSNSIYADNDTCTFTPPLLSFDMPTTPGTAYTDANYGGTVRVITQPPPAGRPRALTQDAIVQPFNANNTLVSTQDLLVGTGYLTDPVSGVDTYTNVPVVNAWDPLNPNEFYTLSGLSIIKNKLAKGNPVKATTLYTYSGGGTAITQSGDGDVTQDGWWCFYPQGAGAPNVVGMINLNLAQVYFTPPLPAGHVPRWCQVSGINVPNGKRYLIIKYNLDRQSNDLYALPAGGTALTYEGRMPMRASALAGNYLNGPACDAACDASGWGITGGHSSVHMIGGVAYLINQGGTSQPSMNWPMWHRLDTGNLMTTPYEAGGGMYVPGFPTDNLQDFHVSAATNAPVAVVSLDSYPSIYDGPPYSLTITNVSGSGVSPIMIGYSESTTQIANGNTVTVASVRGNTAANGTCIVSGLDTTAKTFSCAGTGNGAYVPGTGGVVQSSMPVSISHQTDILLYDASRIALNQFTVTKLAKSRSFSLRGQVQGAGYYGQSHASISRDGSLVAFETNNFLPDALRVAVINTGYLGLPSLAAILNSPGKP